MCEICFLWIGSHFNFAVRWCEGCNQETFGAAPIYSPTVRTFQDFSEFPTFPDPQDLNARNKQNYRISKVNNLHYYNKSDVSAACGLTERSKNSCLAYLMSINSGSKQEWNVKMPMCTWLYNAYNQTREAFDRTSVSRVKNRTLRSYLRYKEHLQFLKMN